MSKHQIHTIGLGLDPELNVQSLDQGLPYFGSDANCTQKGIDPDLFFSDEFKDKLAALAICAGCPVINLCRNYAVENEEYGIWGGTTERQRATLRVGVAQPLSEDTRIALANRAELLSGKPASVLAEQFNKTTRTIQRWQKKLREETSGQKAG